MNVTDCRGGASSRARSARRGDACACRLREAVAERVVPQGARRGRAIVRRCRHARRRAQRDGAGVHRGGSVAVVSQQRHGAAAERRVRRAAGRRICRLPPRRRRARRRAGALFARGTARAAESRTQITRHDCVEGWSAIGKWKGVQLVDAARSRTAEARGALRRVPLRRSDGRRRHGPVLREHRPGRRVPSRRRSSPTS